MQLKEAKVIGEICYHYFKMKDGTYTRVECTRDDYDQLGQQNPKNPTLDGGEWSYSKKDNLYDTPSGDLEDGYYADVGRDSYFVKVVGYLPKDIDKSKLLDGVMDDSETKDMSPLPAGCDLCDVTIRLK